eukprot:686996-Pleurochrysis_carterae.AAC.1
MSRIRNFAARDAGERSSAWSLLPSLRWLPRRATMHAAEFLPGGICAAEQITPEMRERLSGMPMTSTGAERLFASGRAHDVRAGASRDDTRAG